MAPEQHPRHHLDLAASLTLDQIVSPVLEGVVVGDGGQPQTLREPAQSELMSRFHCKPKQHVA